jgi:FkbM family methyltransferase
MVRFPRIAGTLAYAGAWLIPWRSIYRVRTHDTKLTFVVHRRDVIGRHIAKYGAHEPTLTAWIARHLANSPDGIVVDVGANIGWHTVHAARAAAVEMVVAFEPDAFNAWLLNQNLSSNNIDKVVVCAYALGARSDIATLNSYKASNLGRHSLIANYGRGCKRVPMRDLDGVLDDLGLSDRRILVLKIDVEGYEPAVIEGASRALARADVIALEYSPSLSRDGGLSLSGMVERLLGCGFRSFSLAGDGRLTPLSLQGKEAHEEQIDVIWMRRA